MNVYFFGGEDTELTYSGVNIVGSGFRSGWARLGINCPGAGSLQSPVFTAHPIVWAHGQCAIQDQRTTNLAYLIAMFTSAGGQGLVGACGTGTSGQIKLVKRSNAGTVTTLATSAAGAQPGLGQTTPMSVDLFVNYAVSGQATLWINGTLIVDTGTGVDTTTDSSTAGLNAIYCSTAGPNNTTWSEILAADSDTRSAGLALLTSSTAGTAQQWSGTASNVNQSQINDANFIAAASAGLLQEYKPGALPSGGFTVAAVGMTMRASVGTSGPAHVDFLTQIAGTNFFSSDFAPGTAFGNIANYIQAINPSTGVAWTPADLAATNFQYGLRATT